MLVLFSLLCLLVCKTATSHSCQKELKDTRIVPRYADKCGKHILKVLYNGNSTEAHCGNSIQIKNVLTPPTLFLDVKGQCRYLTVMLFDLDAIIIKPFLHLLYVNVPACALRKGYNPSRSKKGDEVARNFYPLAPTNTHRYTFFVYCQQDKMKQPDVHREFFKVKNFAKDNNLGNPIACNFFYLSLINA